MKVISFSLWGDSARYTIGAIRNAELAPKIYPGWQVWVYIDAQSVPPNITGHLIDAGATVKAEPKDTPMMFQRFLVADEKHVERFIIRDCDSRLSEREAAAVQDWVDQDTILHVMRDHPAHQIIPGGMWGAQWRRKNWEAPSMRRLINDFLRDYKGNPNEYQVDQDFLREKIWPWAHTSMTCHDSIASRRNEIGGKPFPTPRTDWPRFVGEVWNILPNGKESPREREWENCPRE